MKRYAIVRGHGITADKVAAYLPANYRVLWSGKCDWHCSGLSGQWQQFPALNDDSVVIVGEDDHGWTLDKYVAPRLGSGLMRCDEIDLSHPIMKMVPDGRPNADCNSPQAGGPELYHCYSLDCPVHGDRNRLMSK